MIFPGTCDVEVTKTFLGALSIGGLFYWNNLGSGIDGASTRLKWPS
jgi:hypothetical protein